MLYCELYGNLYLSDWRGKWPERADGINFIPCTLWLLTATETPGTYDQQLRIVHSSFMTSRKWSNRNTSQALVSRKWVRPAASHLLLLSFFFLLSNKTEDKGSEMRWAPDSAALLKISNHHTQAEGAAKQGQNKMLGEEWRPEHNVVYERILMKAPENENRKGGRKFEGVNLTI